MYTMFARLELLKRPKGPWGVWQPKVRIEPGECLQYKNPVIREYTVREDEEEQERQSPAEQAARECDFTVSNQAE